ncbi:MAG: alcohol dehydrogenase [Desulfuromonas sp.]|nr:MAG: alcohol dehydrogenase [Desulfuromonas sp.]
MIKAYAASEAGGELQPFEYDPGDIGPHEVEIDVEYCGICHSDLSMLDNEWGMSQYPLIPGHEVVGTVAATGSAVTALQPGQKAGLGWHAGYCMTCSTCMSGDHNMCSDAQGTIIGHHGGFADKIRAQAASVVPLPDGIDLESAGPLFCGGVTVFNPLLQFDVQATDKVGVIGIGGLGHMAILFASAWGCEVTAFTSSQAKQKEAKEMGADHVVDSRDKDAVAAIAGQLDLIISTVNVKLDWNTYLSTLKPRGRLHFVGATLDPLDVGVFSLIPAQRSISGSPVGSPVTIAKMLEFAARNQIRPVVETYRFDQVNEAIERLRSGKARYRVVLTK